ncbi:cytochrome b/b6 domain-containing protein [Pseudoduganella namucuonensis]|uniref:Cytochrome b n=1 Tax=Pseudoduganella namucuonensis TaxID=1035707 RepID=A0A1I7JD32_9BURK|nr:cytochrome b/b6 domain-containing protein [Pseudoduganella namucuonensis]SFU83033.1 Cytochrome b [Pseudoduganella namucuonensis]
MSTKTFAGDTGTPQRSARGLARAKLRASRIAADDARDVNSGPRPRGDDGSTARRILVWDLPTRVFHWSLVLAVTVAVATGMVGGDWMEVHGKAGIAITGLLGFRIVWGVAGATHARFRNFAPTPSRLRAYLGGRWQGHGHNPLGALSVFALLSLLAAQAATGLVGTDEIAFTGPLAALVGEELSLRLTGIHQQLAYVLLGFLALHVLAILAYLAVRKNNLVKPMVTGWKEVDGSAAAPGAASGGWPALAAALAVGVLAMVFASGAGLQPGAAPGAFSGSSAPPSAATPAPDGAAVPASTPPATTPAW